MQMVDTYSQMEKSFFYFQSKFHMFEMNSKHKYTKNELVILDLSNANFKMYVCLWVYIFVYIQDRNTR